MKKILLLALFIHFCSFYSFAQKGKSNSQAPKTGKINWSIDPFEHSLFVENVGQFPITKSGDKIYFESKIGIVNALFTTKGVLYCYHENAPLDFSDGKDPDQDGIPPATYSYMRTSWEGANPNVTVDADYSDALSYTYNYPKGINDTYIAPIFKKITYHNLYPGIDVVYSFPEGSKDLKYTIIVHPGGDLSKVHLKYLNSKNLLVNEAGNVVDKNDIGTLTESAPVSYYLEDHAPATVSSQANNPDESFIAHNLDATKTLAIDPTITWQIGPGFTVTTNTGYDYAYDLDYDNLGNIYAYGGGWSQTGSSGFDPLQLVKINPAGVIQWIFDATTMTSSTNFYGDFAVDKHSLESYIVEGWNISSGARIEKVSSTGLLLATDLGNSSCNEMWRIESSICPQAFVVYCGNTNNPDQAGMLDTTMTTFVPVNILGPTCTTGYHDMALTAVDPFGTYAYTGTTKSLQATQLFSNQIVKSPMPALAPATWMAPDGYKFHEIETIFYIPQSGLTFNSMNGMVCGRAWLYAYNGDTLKQFNKATGALNAFTTITSNSGYDWGGLDVDLCDNVYLGDSETIKIFDGTLTETGTLPVLGNIIYALKLGPYTGQLLYACGQNFVASVSLGPPQTVPIVITKIPSCGSCNGTATASAMQCGILDTLNVTYLWSDGETTQTARHLCTGLDSVGVTIICGLTFYDTVTMYTPPGGYTVTHDSIPASCAGPGSASVTITGGASPYTYDWSNGSTTSSTGPVSGGVYCLGIRDNTGCADTLCITVPSSALPTITIAPTPDTVCAGSGVALTASGGVSYVWTPVASGLSCYTCASPTASPIITTTYTVTGTDASGCSNVANAIVNVIPAPVITITAPGDSICSGSGQNITLTAAGATTYSWAPSTGLSTCATCNPATVSPSVTTIYTVTGTDAQGCAGTSSYTIIVTGPPAITVSPDVSICTGQTTTLSVSASGSSGTILWEPGGYNAPSITVSPTSTQVYTVTCTNSCGIATATVTVTMYPTPVPAFTADIFSGCSPLCIQFRNLSTISSGNIATSAWSFGTNDTTTAQSPIYCYTQPGSFSVSLTTTSANGCSASLTHSNMITVYSNPVANFAAAPQPTTILQPTVQFTDESTDTYGVIAQNWNFGVGGDSGTSILQNPAHTYTDTGTYCVKLSVINEHGCVDTMTDCIVIEPIFTLYIPDAFSPNGDGVNELFVVKGNDVKTFEMYIFNRWGLQLFHTTNINQGWNGAVNNSGAISQEDAYVYVIKVTDNKDKPHSYTGTVNIIK